MNFVDHAMGMRYGGPVPKFSRYLVKLITDSLYCMDPMPMLHGHALDADSTKFSTAMTAIFPRHVLARSDLNLVI